MARRRARREPRSGTFSSGRTGSWNSRRSVAPSSAAAGVLSPKHAAQCAISPETELEQAERAVKQTARAVQLASRAAGAARQGRTGRCGERRHAQDPAWCPQTARGRKRWGARASLAERLTDGAAEDLAQARRRVEIVTPLHIDLPRANLPANRTVLRFEEVVLEHGTRRLFGPFELRRDRARADRRARAPMAAGKSSLLRLAMGGLVPTHRAGLARRGCACHARPACRPARCLAGSRGQHAGAPSRHDATRTAHDVLARFAFRNRDARRPVASLSGGERLRAGLASADGRIDAAANAVARRADQPSRPRRDRTAGGRARRL